MKNLGLKAMLALRALAILSCCFGAYRMFSLGSPIGVVLLLLAALQLPLALGDVRKLRRA